MIITTTNNVENREVAEYMGIVFGEVITGVNFFKDIGAGLRDIFGGNLKAMKKSWLEQEMKLFRN